VRAATGWVGVMLLSPFLGAIIYAIAGINRIRRATISAMRPVTPEAAAARHDREQRCIDSAAVAPIAGRLHHQCAGRMGTNQRDSIIG